MGCIVAIQPDDYTDPTTPDRPDASSPKWAELLEAAGHRVRWVDVYRADILYQLRGCRGFMWRHGHSHDMQRVAKRLLPVLEREMDLVVYPDQSTCWHYDDKIAQRYLLEAVGLPIPKTWVWFAAEPALEWAESAVYPMVLKLSAGAGSVNVRLVSSFDELRLWIDRLFGGGAYGLRDEDLDDRTLPDRAKAAARILVRGRPVRETRPAGRLHSNYLLVQEFLSGNPYDTRITVIGNRAFGYRRFNRPGDFRASGSGIVDHDPAGVDQDSVRLAFRAADVLKTQSIAIDALRRGDQRLIAEVSYTYVSWLVHACPGHWELQGRPESGSLIWHDGPLWPEEAQVADYLERLEG